MNVLERGRDLGRRPDGPAPGSGCGATRASVTPWLVLGLVAAHTLALAGGCGPKILLDQGPAPDEALRDGGRLGPAIPWLEAGQPEIDPPSITWLEQGAPPIAWPCPEGWRVVTQDGVTTCDPYPQAGQQVCPRGDAHFPGEPMCAPVGRACGDGPFPSTSDVPDSTVRIYVDAGAPGGGNGSEGSPLRALSDALDAARGGELVVLGAGVYDVDREWPDGVSVRGLCARQTSLTSAEGAGLAAVVDAPARRMAIRIEDLTIGPAPAVGVRVANAGAALALEGVVVREVLGDRAAIVVRGGGALAASTLVVGGTRSSASREDGAGLRASEGADVTLRRAVFAENRRVGLLAEDAGTTLVAEDLVIRDTRPQERDGLGGAGVAVQLGASVTLARALVTGNRDHGVLVAGAGAEARLTDLVVRDTEERVGGAFGRGVGVQLGASSTLDRALLEQNREVGLFVGFEGARAIAQDLVVRDTRSRADGAAGRGTLVQPGGQLELERALLARNREYGLLVTGSGAAVDGCDVAIRDTAQLADGTFGRGLAVEAGARLELARAVLDRNHEAGLLVGSPETAASVVDLLVRDTSSRGRDGIGGSGVQVQEGALLTLGRARLEGNQAHGLLVTTSGAEVRATHLVARGTRSRPDGTYGRGLGVEAGARLTLEGALLERNREVGLLVGADGAEAVVTDLVLRETLSRAGDGTGGRGLQVQLDARLQITRALIEGNRELGAYAVGDGAALELADVVIRATAAPECFPGCEAVPAGIGISSGSGAEVLATRFDVVDNALCGFELADGARICPDSGLVRGHPIAICLDRSRSLSKLQRNMAYEDNDNLVDVRMLTPPDLLPLTGRL
ncbi:MAG: hypothetical protein ACFCGT_04865 [Sandaracinaceae bacterium]